MSTVWFLLQRSKDDRNTAEKQPSSRDLHQSLEKKLLTKDRKVTAR